jgi:CO dehydrogenase/acetyl-CoA synthase beta subunit
MEEVAIYLFLALAIATLGYIIDDVCEFLKSKEHSSIGRVGESREEAQERVETEQLKRAIGFLYDSRILTQTFEGIPEMRNVVSSMDETMQKLQQKALSLREKSRLRRRIMPESWVKARNRAAFLRRYF